VCTGVCGGGDGSSGRVRGWKGEVGDSIFDLRVNFRCCRLNRISSPRHFLYLIMLSLVPKFELSHFHAPLSGCDVSLDVLPVTELPERDFRRDLRNRISFDWQIGLKAFRIWF
jgi:hypothetical protein